MSLRRTSGQRYRRVLWALAAAGYCAVLAVATPPAALATSSQPSATASSAPSVVFSDVQGDEWYADAAQAVGAAAVMLRHYDGSFDAEGTVSRGEMAYFVARALGLEESSTQPFSDIRDCDWFAGSVGALVEAGIIQETDGEFEPEREITRQEAAAMVFGALQAKGDDPTNGDGETSSDAQAPLTVKEAQRWLKGFVDRKLVTQDNLVPVATMWERGILDTPADNQFHASDPLSRAEMVAMLHRAFLGPVFDQPVAPEDLSSDPPAVSIEIGASGTLVEALEARLTGLRYPCGPVDGVYDYRTRDAVMAFEKVEGLERTGTVDAAFWEKLAKAETPSPSRSGKGTRCEVDISRQVLFMITDDKVTEVMQVSTGKHGTRMGHYRIQERYEGWIDCVTVNDYMYYPMYVIEKTAVHGYPNVPNYPASHGCVRTPVWLTPDLFEQLHTGTVIDIFR